MPSAFLYRQAELTGQLLSVANNYNTGLHLTLQVCPLEVTIANTAWDVVALFKCYELNNRCRTLVCNNVQHNIVGLLQGFLPDVVTGAWPYGSLKWLLTCAGSSTLNAPHVIDALLQLLDALHQDEARRVIQIATDAGMCAV